ncbi:MAG: site-specific integrase [Bacteroidota bacterium]
MITVKVVLDNRSVKKDGTSPLKLRLLYNRKSNQLSLGYAILSKDWDAKRERIKSSCNTINNINRINSILLKKKQEAFDILSQLDSDGRLDTLSFKEIKMFLLKKHTDLMTLEFGQQIVEELRSIGKFGNAKAYRTMLSSIREFEKGKDFPLKKITYVWLKKYEIWFLSKGNSVNGLAVYLRSLRALCNQAIKQKHIAKEFYPFDDYKIKTEKTRKRAISQDDLAKIKDFEPRTSLEERSKDYFFLSFYMMGISFMDMAFLKMENIVNGRIEYKRKKTARLYSIPISEPLLKIIKKYSAGKSKKDFILNIITSDDPEQRIKQARNALKRYNKTLKNIAKSCGIEANLTSYVARHSYATIAKYKGVPTAVISEALGHSSEEVTQVYLDSFEKEVLDKYHQMIIE